jgi:hypothetical protein
MATKLMMMVYKEKGIKEENEERLKGQEGEEMLAEENKKRGEGGKNSKRGWRERRIGRS